MGRLRTVGFEVAPVNNTAVVSVDGASAFQGAGVFADSVLFRSGNQSVKIESAVSNIAETDFILNASEVPALPSSLYFRAYVNLTNYPISTCTMMQFITGSTVRLTTTGALQLADSAGVQIGASSAPLTKGTWYRVEYSVTLGGGAGLDAATLQLDGTTIASGSGLTVAATWGTTVPCRLGWVTNAGAQALIMNVDDVAINSSGGTTQNSWPGAGKIVLLKPLSDNARTGWTAGAGGITSLFQAVDNTPPHGSATETNLTNIADIVSSTTDNYDANMTSYTGAGIGSADTITLVQAVIDQGQQSVTGTKAGGLQIVSNPAQSAEDAFTFGTGAIGTWPTGWSAVWGTAQVGDVVAGNRGISPVLRVGKRTATTRETDVDFMGLYVEYVPGTVTTSAHRLALLGVGH